jgi:hypothetical protein
MDIEKEELKLKKAYDALALVEKKLNDARTAKICMTPPLKLSPEFNKETLSPNEESSNANESSNKYIIPRKKKNPSLEKENNRKKSPITSLEQTAESYNTCDVNIERQKFKGNKKKTLLENNNINSNLKKPPMKNNDNSEFLQCIDAAVTLHNNKQIKQNKKLETIQKPENKPYDSDIESGTVSDNESVRRAKFKERMKGNNSIKKNTSGGDEKSDDGNKKMKASVTKKNNDKINSLQPDVNAVMTLHDNKQEKHIKDIDTFQKSNKPSEHLKNNPPNKTKSIPDIHLKVTQLLFYN